MNIARGGSWLAMTMVAVTACTARESPPPSYAGSDTCAECHATEAARWRGSHHDLAMQMADSATVLAPFEGESYSHFGVTSTFFKRDDSYVVRTDDADGELRDFSVSYTFGVFPTCFIISFFKSVGNFSGEKIPFGLALALVLVMFASLVPLDFFFSVLDTPLNQ